LPFGNRIVLQWEKMQTTLVNAKKHKQEHYCGNLAKAILYNYLPFTQALEFLHQIL